jgi:argininosuccinate lyase
MVLSAIEQRKELKTFTLEEMKRFYRQIDKDVFDWLEPTLCIERRNIPGGTGSEAVKMSLEKAREELES